MKNTIRKVSGAILGVMAMTVMSLVPFTAKAQGEAYKDPTLTFEERAADLVSRMTRDEKQSQMTNESKSIPALGVKSYNYWGEALHGIAKQGAATSFPVPLSMTSSWDVVLMEQIATAISNEARGCVDKNSSSAFLSYWSPTINMSRDPRWGRNEESYGEDPFLTAAMARRFVDGMQGTQDHYTNPNTGEQYLKTISTLKHFAANNSEFNRHDGNSVMDNRTLRNYYTWAFMDIAQQTPVACVMNSYNRVNGTPTAAHTYLLDTLLRKTWGFGGHVVSDCWAVGDIVNGHHWAPPSLGRPVNATEAVALCIKAGTDLECGDLYKAQVVNALRGGLLEEDDVDHALLHIFTNRMRTGEFDPPSMVEYTNIKQGVIEAQAHRDLALQSAREGIVLLKNENKQGTTNSILPIDLTDVNSIVVYGPLAQLCDLGFSWYVGSPTQKVSFKQGIEAILAAKDYSGSLTFYDGVTAGDVPEWVMNIRRATFGGDVREAMDADDRSPGVKNEDTNVGYIYPGAFLMFKDVDVTSLGSITLNTSGGAECIDARVEVRLDASDGPLIATVECSPTGNWYTFSDFTTGDVSALFTGQHNVYLVFNLALDFLKQAEIDAAAGADIAIVYAGTSGEKSGFIVGEEKDRTDLYLPVDQDLLIAKVAEKNPNTIAVIQSAGINDLSKFKDGVKAITFNSYNGQYQGTALAETLFGDNNPSGRLPVTWYKYNSQIPDIADYTIKPEGGLGRTYMYFTGDVEYPFGYGLSYTSFVYANVALSATSVAADGTFNVTLDVTNTGTRDGAEVVQVYIGAPDADSNPDVPAKQLKGFARVDIKAGETQPVTIPMNVSGFSMVRQDEGLREVLAGEYKIYIAKSSDDPAQTVKTISVLAPGTPELQHVTLQGEKVVAAVGASFGSDLTLAMSDESFYDVNLATVTYFGTNDDVATVASNGIVTAVGEGVATIKVSVTINGVTREGSFPVAVIADAGEECYTIRTLRIQDYGETGKPAMYLRDDAGTLIWSATADNNSAWYEIPVESSMAVYFKNVATDNYLYRENTGILPTVCDWQPANLLLSATNEQTDYYKFQQESSIWGDRYWLVNLADADMGNITNKGAYILSGINKDHAGCSYPAYPTAITSSIPNDNNIWHSIALPVVNASVANPDCPITAIVKTPYDMPPSANIVGYYNVLGNKLAKEPESGIYIILYDNGKAEKRIK